MRESLRESVRADPTRITSALLCSPVFSLRPFSLFLTDRGRVPAYSVEEARKTRDSASPNLLLLPSFRRRDNGGWHNAPGSASSSGDAGRAPFHYLDCSRVQFASRSPRDKRDGRRHCHRPNRGGVGPPPERAGAKEERAGIGEESEEGRGRTEREGNSKGLPERGDEDTRETRAAGWTDRPGSL